VSYFRDIHGIAALRFLPFRRCVECKLLSRIDFLSRLGTRVLAAATAGQTFQLDFRGDFGGRNEGQNVLAATGPVDQRLVGLGSLRCSLASIAKQHAVLEAVAPTITLPPDVT
jgi:hypothetical protein